MAVAFVNDNKELFMQPSLQQNQWGWMLIRTVAMKVSEQMKLNKCCHCFRRRMLLSGNTSRIIQLYRNTLMTDFAQAFQNDHNNISDAVERDQSAASEVIPSHSAKSHFVWCAWRNLFLQNAFPLPLLALTLFRTSQKPPQASIKLLRIKGFLFEMCCFHHLFLMRYFKVCNKTGWWKPSYCLAA